MAQKRCSNGFSFSYFVRFDDVDAAGIVYYPRYFEICHLTFEEFFNKKGPMRYPQLIFERKLGLPTVHVDASFKRPFAYGDSISINLLVKEIKNSSVTTEYKFFKADDTEICFNAHITTVCIDMVERKKTLMPDELREFFSGYMRQH